MAQYQTPSQAGDYFQNERLGSEDWFTYSSDEHNKALIQSSRLIDTLNFAGDKNDENQELEFPRGTDTTVPRDIEIACNELAFALLVEGRDVEYEAEQVQETAASFGQGRLYVKPSAMHEGKYHMIPSAVAWRHLKPYLRPGDIITLSRVD